MRTGNARCARRALEKVVSEFLAKDTPFHQVSLVLELPPGFFRLETIAALGSFEPSGCEMGFTLRYRHMTLGHSLRLGIESTFDPLTLAVDENFSTGMAEARVKGQVVLSPRDARLFVLWLLRGFQGDDLWVRDNA